MVYYIEFDMISPIVYDRLPVLDGILAWCVYNQERSLSDFHTPQGREVDDLLIPLEIDDAGFYYASYLWHSGTAVEGMDSWKKRWETRYDRIADFGRARRRIDTGSGRYKSMYIPITTQSMRAARFYFRSQEPDEVGDLIRDNLPGFGKKVSIGFGWFADFQIEECEDEKMVYYRPLPADFNTENLPFTYRPSFGSYKIPYWLPVNQIHIIVPDHG